MGKKGYMDVRCCSEGSHRKEKKEQLGRACNWISLILISFVQPYSLLGLKKKKPHRRIMHAEKKETVITIAFSCGPFLCILIKILMFKLLKL